MKAGEEVRNNLRNPEKDWDMKEIELVDGVEISRRTSLKKSNINIDPNQKNKVNRYNNILRNGLEFILKKRILRIENFSILELHIFDIFSKPN